MRRIRLTLVGVLAATAIAAAACSSSGGSMDSKPANNAATSSSAAAASNTVVVVASQNPDLSTLVSAVTKANLAQTLSGPGPYTVFAPTNSAFGAIPADQLNAILADQG